MKPGYKSTEFWLGLLAAFSGVAIVVIGLVRHDQELVDRGFQLLLGSQVGYTVGRGLAKWKTGGDIVDGAAKNLQDVKTDQLIEGVMRLIAPSAAPAATVTTAPTTEDAPK